MPYAWVRGPHPMYLGAWPAYAAFSMHTQAAIQKPEFSFLLLSHFIFLSHMFLFKFLFMYMCIWCLCFTCFIVIYLWYARLGFHLLFLSLITWTCIHMPMHDAIGVELLQGEWKSYTHTHIYMCCYVLFDEHVHVLACCVLCLIDN